MHKHFYFTSVITYADGSTTYYSGYVVSNNSLFNITAAETQSIDYAPSRYIKRGKTEPKSVSIIHHFETNESNYESGKKK
jgi:hypothetical protein